VSSPPPPLPRWITGLFAITVVWGALFLLLYVIR
jgi:hypothetical protein